MTIRILDTQKMRSGLVIGKTNTGLSIWVAWRGHREPSMIKINQLPPKEDSRYMINRIDDDRNIKT